MKLLMGACVLVGVAIGNVIGMEIMDRVWKKQYKHTDDINKELFGLYRETCDAVDRRKDEKIKNLEQRLKNRA